LPPGAKGTISLIGLDGYCWATLTEEAQSKAMAARAAVTARFMKRSP